MTDASGHIAPSAVPAVAEMHLSDLRAALASGWRDFRRAPAMGLFFGVFYALGGLLIYWLMFRAGEIWWALPVTVGFPLLGPFAAAGLYEISHRLEQGQGWTIREILGVIWRQRNRQLPSMAWVIIVYFLFWSFFAHMLFALFLGRMTLVNVSTSYAFLLEPQGLLMLAVGSAFGAIFATILFAITVVSLPLLLDKELDYVTAMITSFSVVLRNPGVMLSWGVIIAVLTFAAMIPAFLGLIVVFPMLGHATWHIYRRALVPADA
ncbi:DUF2189 domain-containing protein [Rhodobacterales bacterium HKCCE2091]|nr:DUF2189 domain-containing protein [Rhodobacterales bacterium HKCCE2091]